MTCGSNISDVNSYSLKTLCPASAPQNFEHLEQWLSCEGRHPNWDGKMYVARTIYWDSDGNEFLQTGCSPNYQAGWWSLACCKHDMREARPFRAEAIDLSIPTWDRLSSVSRRSRSIFSTRCKSTLNFC